MLKQLGVGLLVLLLGAGAASAQSGASADDVAAIMRQYQGAGATELPVIGRTDDGYIRFLGAPIDGHFLPTQQKSTPENAARQFIMRYGRAFGITSPNVGLSVKKVRDYEGQSYVRLSQHYAGVPVFGGEMVAQLDGAGNIVNIASDIMRDTGALEGGTVATEPALSAAQAAAQAKKLLVEAVEDLELTAAELRVKDAAKLVVWKPDVVGLSGPTRLAYQVDLVSTKQMLVRRVFVDAHSGVLIYQYSLIHEARDRAVHDADNTYDLYYEIMTAYFLGDPLDWGAPARAEGSEPTGITDVDNGYDYIGDAYDFFNEHHGRDSYDGVGSTMRLVVHFGDMLNAMWTSDVNTMWFGPTFVVDDIVAHELTHGMTQYTSELIYFGFSGAINESMSDIWGEFIDLSNGDSLIWNEDTQSYEHGPDDPELRWFMGEDRYPDPPGRYMKDPTMFGDPDRLSSPYLINPNSGIDNGGVHFNSGIGNKLAYLLTDGDDFNGRSVSGMGIPLVADLFYAAQNTLPIAADYYDLYYMIGAAAKSMELSVEQRVNIREAMAAVEIIPPSEQLNGLQHFRATAALTLEGDPAMLATWKADGVEGTQLVRTNNRFAMEPGEGEGIYSGLARHFVDYAVAPDLAYYYSIFAEREDGYAQRALSRAVAGRIPAPPAEAFSQEAGGVIRSGIDLRNTQILYTPVAEPRTGLDEPGVRGDFSDYEITVTKGIDRLPVGRNDGDGGAFSIPLGSNMIATYSPEFLSFPYFGVKRNTLYISANGYIAFGPEVFDAVNAAPSLASHYAIDRISYLFANLNTNSTGTMWFKAMPDRLVLTVEDVSEVPLADGRNTVQVELFDSGHIRMSYLDVNVDSAVVGLSDGAGMPVNPAEISSDLQPQEMVSDLSSLPQIRRQLSIEPIAMQGVEVGGRVAFEVTTHGANKNGAPLLRAEWDGPLAAAPFNDNGDGTGSFAWNTGAHDYGAYTVRITADDGENVAYQDVRVIVGPWYFARPEARNLLLLTEAPETAGAEERGAAARDRLVQSGTPLFADYTYYNEYEEDEPETFAEGDSVIHWFRNDEALPGLVNARTVPASLLQSGDVWYFRVVPITVAGYRGPDAASPRVTIDGGPVIDALDPPIGGNAGGEIVQIKGSRFSELKSVYFGKLRSQNARLIDAGTIEAETPPHSAGLVEVTVETLNGKTTLPNAFTYIDGSGSIAIADVNHDGIVNAVDVQIVVNAVLRRGNQKAEYDPDANGDGAVNASDIQVVVNQALRR